MENVNYQKSGNPTRKPRNKPPTLLMAARVPVPVAEEIEQYCQAAALTKTKVIIEALEKFFSVSA